jgi:hypothetical protein
VSSQSVDEAKAKVKDLLHQIEYLNAVHWPWGSDVRAKVIRSGSVTLKLSKPEEEDS